MLRRKITSTEKGQCYCIVFVALIASAIEHRKQHDTTDENDIEAIGEITSNVDDAQNNATGKCRYPEIIDVEEEDGMALLKLMVRYPDNSLELQIVNFIKNDTLLKKFFDMRPLTLPCMLI